MILFQYIIQIDHWTVTAMAAKLAVGLQFRDGLADRRGARPR